jgi:repressor LexA
LIDPCEEVKNGEVAAVSVDGQDATLKRFYHLQNTLVLEPDSFDPSFKAWTFDPNKEDLIVKVLGRKWFMSSFDARY